MTSWAQRFRGMSHEDRVMTIVEDGSTLDALIAEALAEPAQAPATADAMRQAMVKVRAHTSYYHHPTVELLTGLLASIERIANEALAADAPQGEAPALPARDAKDWAREWQRRRTALLAGLQRGRPVADAEFDAALTLLSEAGDYVAALVDPASAPVDDRGRQIRVRIEEPKGEAPAPPVDKHAVGLYRKFRVERTDGSSEPGGKHDGCDYFVLDLTHDPHALPSLAAYAASCRADYPLLAADLDAKLPAEDPKGEAPAADFTMDRPRGADLEPGKWPGCDTGMARRVGASGVTTLRAEDSCDIPGRPAHVEAADAATPAATRVVRPAGETAPLDAPASHQWARYEADRIVSAVMAEYGDEVFVTDGHGAGIDLREAIAASLSRVTSEAPASEAADLLTRNRELLALIEAITQQREAAEAKVQQLEADRASLADAIVAWGQRRGLLEGNPSMTGPEVLLLLDELEGASILDKNALNAQRSRAEAAEAQRTVESIATMLGWLNTPPRRTLEMDIAALKARAQAAPSQET